MRAIAEKYEFFTNQVLTVLTTPLGESPDRTGGTLRLLLHSKGVEGLAIAAALLFRTYLKTYLLSKEIPSSVVSYFTPQQTRRFIASLRAALQHPKSSLNWNDCTKIDKESRHIQKEMCTKISTYSTILPKSKTRWISTTWSTRSSVL